MANRCGECGQYLSLLSRRHRSCPVELRNADPWEPPYVECGYCEQEVLLVDTHGETTVKEVRWLCHDCYCRVPVIKIMYKYGQAKQCSCGSFTSNESGVCVACANPAGVLIK